MAPFQIVPCTIDDGLSLAQNNIYAFWTDPTWVLMWPGKTKEYVTAQAARRMPHNLLTDRKHRRHQKVVDTQTGRVVGYARWDLPDLDDAVPGELEHLWPEARVAAVDSERAIAAEREFKAADWDFDHSLDELDEKALAIKRRLMKPKEYIVLDYLAVSPDQRYQGIATMLVQSGIAVAERLGMDVFVHGMQAGLGVYTRLGFELIEQIILNDSNYGGKGEYASYFLVKKCKPVQNDGP
ncbi:hypothetical protein V1515DRAFT_645294 [Lipomyces mesembrius]